MIPRQQGVVLVGFASVRKLTRQLCLDNVYFPKLDQVSATVEQAKAAQATFICRLL